MEFERGLVRTAQGYIHYRAIGSGPAIMLQHINQQSSALLVELMQVLGTRMRAVAIDYPGHGHSDHVQAQPTIGDYARRVVDVMDALGIGQAAVIVIVALRHASSIEALGDDGVGNSEAEQLGVLQVAESVALDAQLSVFLSFSIYRKQRNGLSIIRA